MKVLVVTSMYPCDERPSYGSFVKSQVDSLVKKGVQADILFIQGYRNKLDYLRAMFSVMWRCMRKRYDIVHAHYGLSGIVARTQLRSPVIVSFVGDDLYGHADSHGRPTWTSLFWVWWHKRLSSVVDAVIVKSDALRLLVPGERATVIPNGVDFDQFKPMNRAACRQRLGLSDDIIYILFPYHPARLRKNYPLVEAAVAKLNATMGRRVEILVVCGIPNEKMPIYMNAANVLVLASYWEGSPNAVKEAMACNLPVVSMDVGDVREIIDGVEGCALFRPEADDLARTLSLVLAGPAHTEGRAAIEHLRIERIADRVLDLYREVLSGKRTGGR